MLVHVHLHKRYDNARFQQLLAEDWKRAALHYYTLHYDMSGADHTDEELALLKAWRTQLQETTPPDLREGVHLLHPGAADLGEDIYIADGMLQHTLHRAHTECGGYALLWRAHKLWCACCEREVSHDETSN